MTDKNKYIEDLIERFFDGLTSNEEEQQLYLFFSKENIPAELEPYRKVFRYFESDIIEELGGQKKVLMPTKTYKRKHWTMWIGIAATLLLLLTIRQSVFTSSSEYDPFEGSYIVVNGERITDLDKIRPELEATTQIAFLKQQKADRLLSMLEETDQTYQQIQEEITAQYCDIVHKYPNGPVREEIKEILGIECN